MTKQYGFLPRIDASRCTGCGWCVAACHLHLLSLEPTGWRKSAVLADTSLCNGCRKCEAKCLFDVIKVERLPMVGATERVQSSRSSSQNPPP